MGGDPAAGADRDGLTVRPQTVGDDGGHGGGVLRGGLGATAVDVEAAGHGHGGRGRAVGAAHGLWVRIHQEALEASFLRP